MLKKRIKQVLGKTLPFFSSLFRKKISMDSSIAKSILESYSPKPVGTPIAKNTITNPTCDLQIIIPAYNVEDYLEECLDSILSQETKYTYKVVLVDDGSTDRTAVIADKYSSHANVIVIHQENKGISSARNVALQNLFGKYIMFVDSDDKLCPGAIEVLLKAAFDNDSDIVEGGALRLEGNVLVNYSSHREEKAISNISCSFRGEPWAKVFKATCFENISFPEGFLFEDTITVFLLYRENKRFYVIDKYVYIYRKNTNSISYSSRVKPKSLDSYWITEKLMEVCELFQYPFDKYFFNVFLYQLIMNQIRISKLPDKVQQSVFVLSIEMMNKYFDISIIQNNKNSLLVKALTTNDWGLFKIYCKLQ